MEKRIIRTQNFEINFIPFFGMGIGYHDEELVVIIPFFVFVLKIWSFGRKKNRPTTF